jgi:hypothetical protein
MPITIVDNAAIQMVDAIAASFGIPASERIFGFTNMIYANAMNVVMPAMISVRTELFFSRILNILSTRFGF